MNSTCSAASPGEAGAAAGAEGGPGATLALNVQMLRLTDARLELLADGGAAPTVIEVQRLEAQDLNRMPAHQTAGSCDCRQSKPLPGSAGHCPARPATAATGPGRPRDRTHRYSRRPPSNCRPAARLTSTGGPPTCNCYWRRPAHTGEGRPALHYLREPQIDATLHFNQFDPRPAGARRA